MSKTVFSIPLYCFRFSVFCFLFIAVSSCSISKQINKQATKILLQDSVIATGHIGISIYEPATNTYWYNYNADKFFVPASNVKLFTLYAGMKYLGDSLVGIYYQNFSDTAINIMGTGDPTFLYPNFTKQPVLDFLKSQSKTIYLSGNYNDSPLGKGWAWDDYNEAYMSERNAFPIYGNTIKFRIDSFRFKGQYYTEIDWSVSPKLFRDSIRNYYSLPLKARAKRLINDSALNNNTNFNFFIFRKLTENNFTLKESNSVFTETEIPFYTNGNNTAIRILQNDFSLKIKSGRLDDNSFYGNTPNHLVWHSIMSQPTDSLLKPMMWQSNNFFAEQTLICISQKKWWNSIKNATEATINNILKNELLDIPQQPRWVDGSGLSRYNLFTPQSFIYILNKLKNEFGLERMKRILPTGGQGTIQNYYGKDSGYIFAKTGSMGNQATLSGYLITKQNKLLIFSILNNNFQGKSFAVKRAVEKFLQGIREKY